MKVIDRILYKKVVNGDYGMPNVALFDIFYIFIRSSSLLLYIFIFVFNLCSFLLYIFCFYSIFDHFYSISVHFYCICFVSILYSIISM